MGREGGVCRLLNAIISFAFFAVGAYVIWLYLGQPDFDDLQDFGGSLGDSLGNISDIGDLGDIDFGDFTDVLGNLTGDLDSLWDLDPFVGDNTTSAWPTKGEGGLELELQVRSYMTKLVHS